MASVFDRLARQGTASSRMRRRASKENREQHQQRRAAAAAASFPMTMGNPVKLQQLQPPQDQSGPMNMKSLRRTPKQQDAFYNRLAQQETTSSAALHIHIPDRHESLLNPVTSPEKATSRSAVSSFHMTMGNPVKLLQLQPPQDQAAPMNMKSPRRTPKQQDAFYNRLAQQETISSAAYHIHIPDHHESLLNPVESPEKLLQLQQDQSGPMKSPRRTPKQQDAFYNRLSQQETIASAAHHIRIPDHHESLLNLNPVNSPEKATSPSEQDAFYNRLYKQETAAIKAHHLKLKEETQPFSPRRANHTPPPSLLKRLEQHKTATAASKAHHLREETQPLSPRRANHTPPPSLLKRLEQHKTASGPPIPIKMNLHIRTKEAKKGGKPYGKLNISQVDVRKLINLFHSGKISAHVLASGVINALFLRDFVDFILGSHWEIGSAMAEEVDTLTDKEGEKISIFEAEKEAIWDWKDVYSVALARATIKISSGDIYVDEYSYYVAG